MAIFITGQAVTERDNDNLYHRTSGNMTEIMAFFITGEVVT